MKVFSLGLLISVSFTIVACETMNQPITNSSFDPLVAPGSGTSVEVVATEPDIAPGTFVTANIPNTAFYNNKPSGTEDADKLLAKGTNMKIVSADSSYVKVELDSGEVGWIPSVMVASAAGVGDANAIGLAADTQPIDATYQVYPPLPQTGPIEPLPIIDPSGLPPAGAIPTIIDPDAPIVPPVEPITIDPIPDLKPAEPEDKPDDAPKEKSDDPDGAETEAEESTD